MAKQRYFQGIHGAVGAAVLASALAGGSALAQGRADTGAAAGSGLSAAAGGGAGSGAGSGAPDGASAVRWQGWTQLGAAYTFGSPAHWSQLRGRAELAGTGKLAGGVKWKLSARAGYDAVYDGTDFYPGPVRRDQRSELVLREAYVDFSGGDWEFRLGKQNIVWGEMVGLFFADVVSAKDMREFVLPDFEQIRIPQWAARAEWFGDDTHLEFVWLPAPATDLIGKPGAEFYAYPPAVAGMDLRIDGERRPSRRFSNGGFGARGSMLAGGWDVSAFVYRSPDSAATFYRTVLDVPQATIAYQPRFDPVKRVGGTLAKDFDGIVFKAEAVYTDGRKFGSSRPDAPDGLLELRTLDWIVGADLTPGEGWRINGQFYQRAFLDHDRSIGLRRHENGASLLVSRDFGNGVEAELLAISSLVRSDWMLRPAVIWKIDANSRLKMGVDLFGGAEFGLFGRYADRDRVYAEYRYSF